MADTSSNKSSTGATSMAELLQRQKTTFVSTKKGETVKGKVTKLSSSEILLDINAKTEAVVLEKERRIMKQLLGMLKVGDEVTATVLNPESDMGYTVVSLRRFAEETLWNRLEQMKRAQEKLHITVRENTKGGFIAEMSDGTTGFLPNSHISFSQNQQMIGKTIEVIIVELDKNNKKIVFSQKAAAGDEDFKKAKQALKVNDLVTVTVINVTSFGVFVSVPVGNNVFVDGLIHISEVSWEKIENIAELFTTGQELEAKVIGFDNEAKRVDLSIKKLTKDPFEEIAKAFPVDKKVTGKVVESNDQGILIDLDIVGAYGNTPVQGLIKKDKVPPGTTYTAGQQVSLTVSQIEEKKRRILLVPILKEKPIGYR